MVCIWNLNHKCTLAQLDPQTAHDHLSLDANGRDKTLLAKYGVTWRPDIQKGLEKVAHQCNAEVLSTSIHLIWFNISI